MRRTVSADPAVQLNNDKIVRLLARYFLTTFVGLCLNSVYTLTDTLFVGWGVGDDATGGISLVLPFVFLQSAISTALGGGAASLISRYLGNKDRDNAANVVFHARLVFYVTAILVTLFGFLFMEPILKLFGATGDLYRHAKTYYIVILAGNVFSTGFSSIVRAEGHIVFSMLLWVVPVGVNIVLDAIFILACGWGVVGSALATVLCQVTGFSMSLVYFWKKSALKPKKRKFQFKTVVAILKIGLPALVQSLCLSVQLLIVNNILASANGNTAVEAFAYLNKYVMFASMPFLALMQALSPIVGFHFGAGHRDKIREAVKSALLSSFLYAVAALVLAESVPRYLLMAFTDDPELLRLGSEAMRILAAALPFMPLPMLLAAVFQAEGKVGRALLLFSASTLFLCVASPVFSLFLGLNGVWWGYVAANALASVVALLFVLIKKRPPSEPEIENVRFDQPTEP